MFLLAHPVEPKHYNESEYNDTNNKRSVVAKAKVDNWCLYVLRHNNGLNADVVIASDVD